MTDVSDLDHVMSTEASPSADEGHEKITLKERALCAQNISAITGCWVYGGRKMLTCPGTYIDQV